jgi:hypothetical protein
MNTFRLSNIPLSVFREFLFDMGCERVSVEGGHEKWRKEGCLRSVILQTHIDPVPEFIVRSNLRTLGLTRKDIENWMRNR